MHNTRENVEKVVEKSGTKKNFRDKMFRVFHSTHKQAKKTQKRILDDGIKCAILWKDHQQKHG